MEERHKRILQRNRVNLVRDLNPSDMYDGLLSKGIFTQDMIDEIKVVCDDMLLDYYCFERIPIHDKHHHD